MGCWREPHDQDIRMRVAESRHRASPIILIGERSPFRLRYLFAPFDQPRAGSAGDDVGVESPQGVTHGFNGR